MDFSSFETGAILNVKNTICGYDVINKPYGVDFWRTSIPSETIVMVDEIGSNYLDIIAMKLGGNRLLVDFSLPVLRILKSSELVKLELIKSPKATSIWRKRNLDREKLTTSRVIGFKPHKSSIEEAFINVDALIKAAREIDQKIAAS
ncbi:MAG: hypothetical protein M1338_01245 [Patescibacteria group bacterium]|nr:hypothetical protein [Patescibacteria group bacterium]